MLMEISPATHSIEPHTRFVAFEVFGKRTDPAGAVMKIAVPQGHEHQGVVFALRRTAGPRWELEWDKEIPKTMRVRLNIQADRGGPTAVRLIRSDDRPVGEPPPAQAWLKARINELMAAGYQPVQAAKQAQSEQADKEIDRDKLAARMADLMAQGIDPKQAAEDALAEQEEQGVTAKAQTSEDDDPTPSET